MKCVDGAPLRTDKQRTSPQRLLPLALGALLTTGLVILAAVTQGWWSSPRRDRDVQAVGGHTGPNETPESKLSGAGSPTTLTPRTRDNAALPGKAVCQVTWDDDGGPAQGIRVVLVPATTPNALTPFAFRRLGYTTSAGELEFREIPPGPVRLYVERAGSLTGTVVPGQPEVFSIVAKADPRLGVVTVDELGKRLRHARVLGHRKRGEPGQELGSTDDRGLFLLKAADRFSFLSADKEGYLASALHPTSVGTEGVTVELTRSAANLTVRAFDSTGRPARLCQALLEPAYSIREARSLRLDGRQPAVVQRAREAGEGQLVFSSAPVGTHPLEVSAPGCAVWSTGVAIDEGPNQVTVSLHERGLVEGRVTTESGLPVEAAWVKEEGGGLFPRARARTGTDGIYRLYPSRTGPLSLTAGHPELGRDVLQTVLVAGGRLEWDPVLEEGRSLSGRVVDAQGEPLAHWLVDVASTDHVAWTGQVRSGEDGRWSIAQCQGAEFCIEACPPLGAADCPHAWVCGVSVESEDVLLVVDTDAHATVTGRVLWSNHQPVVGVVQARALASARGYPCKLSESGRFSLELRAGSYDFEVRDRGRLRALVRAVDLEERERFDLGVILVPRPGSLTVEVVRSGVDTDDDPLEARLYTERMWIAPDPVAGDRLVFADIPPGDFTLSVRGASSASVQVPVSIAEGVDERMSLLLDPGWPALVRIEDARGAHIGSRLEATVYDKSGDLVYRDFLDVPATREIVYSRRYVAGAYHLIVATADRVLGSCEYRIPLPEGVSTAGTIILAD